MTQRGIGGNYDTHGGGTLAKEMLYAVASSSFPLLFRTLPNTVMIFFHDIGVLMAR